MAFIKGSRNTQKFWYACALLLLPACLAAQDTLKTAGTITDTSTFEQQDIKDWFQHKGWTKPKPPKNTFILIIPVVASNPTAGFIFGAGLTTAFKADARSRFSSMSANATYSTKGFLNLNVKSNIFLSDDRLVINNDWRYQISSETTYGLGSNRVISSKTGLNGYEISRDSIGQPLTYDLVRLHTTGSWKVWQNLFAGIGFQYDYYFNIKDEVADAGDSLRSFHYLYSRYNGFNPEKYTTSGFTLNLLFDSRDNQVNAYKGYYGNVNFLVNAAGLGSTQNSTMLLLEYRSFHNLSKNSKPKILAFWFYGDLVTSGEAPYIALPALGYDQRQRSGRGYSFGAFRGEKMLYAETEYRFPISQHTGILGGVLFANATTASNVANTQAEEKVNLMENVRPAFGGGLRIMLDKKTRTRLQVDLGYANKSLGIYFGAQETF
ncbi:BamA/TamA family outer membrane protein [Flavihumibacter petaseus]|uniref:Bacterial surface antigen (D15) domain-containing protein n=1 Tax=Flavihumibacter petaseus NBRC 106054 TaxID=1220578 RepID=A0A0E9N4G0_9BACT|nr:BamA/TamA family outer membrane protein [Flavihumibacter petaseus]GAO44714.1 hypothetical protein FPE01S_03_07530 [Flavihumibacter petaseus NBRC 106054]